MHKNIIYIFPPLPAPHIPFPLQETDFRIEFCFINSKGILTTIASPRFIFAPYRSELFLLGGLE